MEKLDINVISVEKEAEGQFRITLAVKNNTEEVIRMTGLHDMKSVVLLDKDGFATILQAQGADITVIGNTAVRQRYTFRNVEGTPSVIRIYGHDFELPEAVAAKKEDTNP